MVLDGLIDDGGSGCELVSGVYVNTRIAFSNHKGVYKKGIEKRQRKLLESIRYIKPFLDDGEEILLVTSGCSPMSLLEQIFTGWIIYMLKHAQFIFTNKRVFHVPATMSAFSFSKKSRYRDSIAQILYSDCEFIKQSWRTLKVKYKSGKKESFYHIESKERKKAKMLLKSVSLAGKPSVFEQRMHLCPRCGGMQIKNHFECPHCDLLFKSKKEARSISIWCPGGGYFYTRHPVLGVFDAIAEVYLMFLVCMTAVGAFKGDQDSVFALVSLGLALLFEKILTISHSNHFLSEFIPVDKNVVPFERDIEAEVLSEYATDDTDEFAKAAEYDE